VIALHVADDSFLQPQPGTSAGDHLVSGLVPLAVLGLAAASYQRLRGGARGAIALLLGVFGIAAAIEAVHYTRHVGPSGDDFTGLLCIPAGLALLGLGVVTLWTTRRRGGAMPVRVLRRAGLGVVALIVALFLVFPIGYAYVGTHVARPPVEDIDLGSAAVEDVQLHTSDRLALEGSYVPSENGAAVIVAFGRKGTQDPARMLARNGHGVLIFDRRGEGDGDPNPYAATARSGGELRSVPGNAFMPVAINTVITPAVAVFSNANPPPHLIDLVDDIAPRSMFVIYAPEIAAGEERRFNTAFYRAAGQPKGDLGRPGSRVRRRPGRTPARVRAARDGILRPSPAGGAAMS
jgi:hypothetical protein